MNGQKFYRAKPGKKVAVRRRNSNWVRRRACGAFLVAPRRPAAAEPGPRWSDFAELEPLFNIQPTHLPVTDRARDQLRAENDLTVARLYGITSAELVHLLRSFKRMATKRPAYLALLQP